MKSKPIISLKELENLSKQVDENDPVAIATVVDMFGITLEQIGRVNLKKSERELQLMRRNNPLMEQHLKKLEIVKSMIRTNIQAVSSEKVA